MRFYSYYDGTIQLNRVKYTISDNGEVTLGEVNEVRIVYEDVQASTGETGDQFSLDGSDNAGKEAFNAQNSDDAGQFAEGSEENFSATENVESVTENVTESNDAPISSKVEDNAQVAANEGTSAEHENIQKEENSGAASFTESERAELEGLKREKKLNLLNDYKEFLDDAEFVDFTSRIDEFTEEKLELELLKKYKARQSDSPNTMAPFAMFQEPEKNETDAEKLASYIRRNLNK